jgi:hypothetical protein
MKFCLIDETQYMVLSLHFENEHFKTAIFENFGNQPIQDFVLSCKNRCSFSKLVLMWD